jgi:hypothetical protein
LLSRQLLPLGQKHNKRIAPPYAGTFELVKRC